MARGKWNTGRHPGRAGAAGPAGPMGGGVQMQSLTCAGCGRDYGSWKAMNAHHSSQYARPQCQGRERAMLAEVTFNLRDVRARTHTTDMNAHAPDSEPPRADSDPAGGPGPAPLQVGETNIYLTCFVHVLNTN
jgi:hypothetical protein